MVRHIVMWTLKEEVDGVSAKENGTKMKDMLLGLKGRIEGCTHIEVSDNIIESTDECQIVLCSEHDDKAALDYYQAHAEHQACVSFVKTVVSSRKAIDYEI